MPENKYIILNLDDFVTTNSGIALCIKGQPLLYETEYQAKEDFDYLKNESGCNFGLFKLIDEANNE